MSKNVIFFLCIFLVLNSKLLHSQIRDAKQFEIFQHLYANDYRKVQKELDLYINSKDPVDQIIGYTYESLLFKSKRMDSLQWNSIQKAKDVLDSDFSEEGKAYLDFAEAIYSLKINDAPRLVESIKRSSAYFNKQGDNDLIIFFMYQHLYTYNLVLVGGSPKDSFEYVEAIRNIAEKYKEPLLLSFAYLYYGMYYNRLDDMANGELYLKKAFDIAQTIDNETIRNKCLLTYYSNMMSIYITTNKLDNAVEYGNKFLEIASSNKHFQFLREGIATNFLRIYDIKGDHDKQLEYANLAFKYLNEDQSSYSAKDFERKAYIILNNLAAVYEDIKNIKLANDTRKKSKDHYDKYIDIISKEHLEKINIISQQHQKNEEINKLKSERYLYGSTLLTIILFLFILLYIFYNRKKMKEKENLILSKDRENAILNLKIEKEEKDRVEIEHSLLKLKEEKLLKEGLANAVRLETNNKLINEIKEEAYKNKNTDIEHLLRKGQLVDNDLESLQIYIENVDSNFYKKLEEISPNKLTWTDHKYAAYILLNMDNQQISEVMNVDLNTVRVTKYRLKKKLELNREQDLTTFLQKLL